MAPSRCYVCACDLSGSKARGGASTKASADLPVPLTVWNEFFKGSLPWKSGPKAFCALCKRKLNNFRKAHEHLEAMKLEVLQQVKCAENQDFIDSPHSLVSRQTKIILVRPREQGKKEALPSRPVRRRTAVRRYSPDEDYTISLASRERKGTVSIRKQSEEDALSEDEEMTPQKEDLVKKKRNRCPSTVEKVSLQQSEVSVLFDRDKGRKTKLPENKKVGPPSGPAHQVCLQHCKEIRIRGVSALSCKLCCERFDDKNDFLSHFEQEHSNEVPNSTSLVKPELLPFPNDFEDIERSGGKEVPEFQESKYLSKHEEALFVGDSPLLVQVGPEKNVDEEEEEERNFVEVKVKGEIKLVCRLCEDEYCTKEDFDFHFFNSHKSEEPVFSDFEFPVDAESQREDDQETAVKESFEPTSRRMSVKTSLFPCRYKNCEETFWSGRKRTQHVLTFHSTSSYKCPVCADVFSHHRGFQRHIREHDAKGEAVFRCDICDAFVDTYREFMKHRRKHKEIQYACVYCQAEFPTVKDRKDHYQTHVIERPHECGDCGERFEEANQLKKHLRIHTSQTRKVEYRCLICQEPFSSRGERRQHESSLHQTCPDPGCSGSHFRVFSLLARHIRLRHPDIFQPKYICSKCSKGFRYQETLRKHERSMHCGAPRFQCSGCGRLFRDKSNLKGHFNLVHSKDDSLVCPTCNKRCGKPSDLKRHIERSHLKVKRYRCSLCPKTFLYSYGLSRHRRCHTMDRLFACPFCRKAFNSWDNRHAHMFIHFDKKMYQCKHCGEGFMRLQAATVHLKKAHSTYVGEDASESILKNKPFRYVGDGSIEVTTGCGQEENGSLGIVFLKTENRLQV